MWFRQYHSKSPQCGRSTQPQISTSVSGSHPSRLLVWCTIRSPEDIGLGYSELRFAHTEISQWFSYCDCSISLVGIGLWYTVLIGSQFTFSVHWRRFILHPYTIYIGRWRYLIWASTRNSHWGLMLFHLSIHTQSTLGIDAISFEHPHAIHIGHWHYFVWASTRNPHWRLMLFRFIPCTMIQCQTTLHYMWTHLQPLHTCTWCLSAVTALRNNTCDIYTWWACGQ